MKLADELVVQHGFDPVNMAPEAWKANKAIATSVDEALSRAAQECRKQLAEWQNPSDAVRDALESAEKAILSLMSGGRE